MRRVSLWVKTIILLSMAACHTQGMHRSETLYEFHEPCIRKSPLTCSPGLRHGKCEHHDMDIKDSPQGKLGRYAYHWDSEGIGVFAEFPMNSTRRWTLLNVTCTNASRLCELVHYNFVNGAHRCNDTADELRFSHPLPSRVLAFEGDYLDLICLAEDRRGQVPVTWYKDNVKLQPEASVLPEASYLIRNNTSSLVIPHLTRSDVGHYMCEANNGSQVIRSSTLVGLARHLHFTAPTLSEIFIREYWPLRLACHAEGFPRPALSWTFAGSQVSNVTTEADQGVVVLLSGVQRESAAGLYICHADNGLETRTRTVWVRVNGVPPAPRVDLHVGDHPSRSGHVPLTVTWHLPKDTDMAQVPVSSVHLFLVRGPLVYSVTPPDATHSFSADTHELKTEAEVDTNYTLAVWLVNDMGHSPLTFVNFLTPPGPTASSNQSQLFKHSWVLVVAGICVGFVVSMMVMLIVVQWRHFRHQGIHYQRHCRLRTESESEIIQNDFNDSGDSHDGRTWSWFANPLFNEDNNDDDLVTSENDVSACCSATPRNNSPVRRNVSLEFIPSSPIYTPANL